MNAWFKRTFPHQQSLTLLCALGCKTSEEAVLATDDFSAASLPVLLGVCAYAPAQIYPLLKCLLSCSFVFRTGKNPTTQPWGCFWLQGNPRLQPPHEPQREGQPLTPNLCGHQEKKREIQRGLPPLKKKREFLKGLLLVCFTDGEAR